MTSDQLELQEELTLHSSGTQATRSSRPEGREDAALHEPREAAGLKTQVEECKPHTPANYIEGLPLAFVCFGLVLGIMCLALDRSIIATAIPKITEEFNSLDDVAWYGSAYLLTSCCFQLMFGKMYIAYKANWVFLTALGLFEIGSLISGCAPNSVSLIIGRAIAGVGSAGMMTGAFTILARSVPLEKRPMYTGYIKGASGIAQIIGPTLGGVITDRATWRWCFWINLPLGAVTASVIVFLVKLPPLPNSKKRDFRESLAEMDLPGTAVLMPWVVCLLLALQWGGAVYAWSNWRVILCLCLFGAMFPLWIYIQYVQGDKGTLPLRIAKQRSVFSGMIFTLAGSGSLFVFVYYIPIWFQSVKDMTAEQSGVNFLASAGPLTLAAVLSGISATKGGYYVPQMILSSITTSVAAGLIYRYEINTSTGYWVGTLIMFGAGTGIGLQMPVTAVQTVLKGVEISIGTSLILLVQTLGGAIFIAVGQNVFQSTLVTALAITAPQVDPGVVLANGVSGITALITRLYNPQAVQGVLEAYNRALQQCFLVCIVLSCATLVGAVFMEWKNVKVEGIKMPHGDGGLEKGKFSD